MKKQKEICVSINMLDKEDVQVLERVLIENDVSICETVDHMYDAYQEDYYGVDKDGDAIFFSSWDSYGENVEVLSHREFIDRFENNGEGLVGSSSDNEEKVLLKIVDENGVTYLFNSVDDIRRVLESREKNMMEFASLVFDEDGDMIKNNLGFTDLGLLEAGFVIKDF